jgi:DNA-directed RNA polymerase
MRKARDAASRKRLAELMGEEMESPSPSTSSSRSPAPTGENPAVEAMSEATVDATTEVEDELDAEVAEPEPADGGEDDEFDLQSGSAALTSSSASTKGVELTNADLAELASKADKEVPEEKIENQRFVKFADVLPPCPPRGVFDVNRIRESAYFFS